MTNSEAVDTRNITFRVPTDLAEKYREAVKPQEQTVSSALRLHMRETVARVEKARAA